MGSASLFEKPRSRVRKMPRFLGSLDRTSDDDYYCDDHAYYNSNVYHTNDSY
jgi:hypothetical protein